MVRGPVNTMYALRGAGERASATTLPRAQCRKRGDNSKMVRGPGAAQRRAASAEYAGVGRAWQQSVLPAVRQALRTQHALLLLDTCEHVIQACAIFVEALLADCPCLVILAP
jgi:predicted ATPase